MYIVKGILITEDGFILNDILINNEASLNLAFQRVKAVYKEQEEWFLAKIKQKTQGKQSEAENANNVREKKG